MLLSVLVFFAGVLVAAATSSPRHDFVIHERRDEVPHGFIRRGPAAPESRLELRIALSQPNLPALEQIVLDVSTPSSARYGQHLSTEQLLAYSSPLEETVEAVNEWLYTHGILAQNVTLAGDWLITSVNVSTANRMLDADFSEYVHSSSGRIHVRTLSYSIPAFLRGHIDLIHPTVIFPERMVPSVPSVFKRGDQNVTLATRTNPCAGQTYTNPACLESYYGIPSTPAIHPSNYIGVTALSGHGASEADLSNFLTHYRTDISSSTTFSVVAVAGGSNGASLSEGDADTQYTVGVATGVPVTLYAVGTDYIDLFNYLASLDNPPSVLTTSYGDGEPNASAAYQQRVCQAAMTLTGRGTSIIFSSGDQGVGPDCSKFNIAYPANCPWITAVGSTTVSAPESAATFTTGGFSNVFQRPTWQDSAVTSYLSQLGSTFSGKYNASGRAVPDVSTHGYAHYVWNNSPYLFSGTSISAPIFASVIALLNDERMTQGKPKLGFLNPWLYSTAASAFNDITLGSNPGPNNRCGTGFQATTGWDAATGLGTPNYANLRTAAGL